MKKWIKLCDYLPEQKRVVSIRVAGTIRRKYYVIDDRWYCLTDLDCWKMKLSSNWAQDRSWYLDSDCVEMWEEEAEDEDEKN